MLFFQQSHWNGLENLREQRRRKLMKLIVKASKGDEKAKKAIRKYDEEEKILREKATETGYYWV
jgi:F0F1-type ATP synthase membrane subunit b/b'